MVKVHEYKYLIFILIYLQQTMHKSEEESAGSVEWVDIHIGVICDPNIAARVKAMILLYGLQMVALQKKTGS